MSRLSLFFCLIVWLMAASIFNPKAEAASIRIGVLPIVESLPFLVAQERGLFHSSGLKVEIVSFASALERDSAIQSGAIHGAIHDILSLKGLKIDEVKKVEVKKIALRVRGSSLRGRSPSGAEPEPEAGSETKGREKDFPFLTNGSTCSPS